jgi:predicted nucleic acid-binding protein
MTEIAFFDTNILLYLFDQREALKQEIARKIFLGYLESKTLRISTQVVQEFYSAATKKLRIPPYEAAAEVEALCGLEMITVSRVEILRAIGITHRIQISFWDALIISAAEAAGATILFTEDLAHGQRIGSIQIVNPFHTLSS